MAHGITDTDLYECEERLREALGWRTMPDAVWGRLTKEEYVTTAITWGCKGHEWKQLIDRAREIGREMPHSETGTNLPPDDRDRKPPETAGVRLDEYTRLRAEVFSEVTGALANRWAMVRRFRDVHLGNTDARLTAAEAGAWLYRKEAPTGALEELREVSRHLSQAFRWRVKDADWFVLTGYVPFVRPVTVAVRRTSHRDTPNYLNECYFLKGSDFMVNTAEIVITAEPWVDANVVARAFREVQKQVNGGDNHKVTPKVLDAVRFVARRLGKGKIRWPQLTAGWNKSQEDPENHYRSRNGLPQAFSRFLRPQYKSPKFPDYEPTPWQEAERAEGEAVLAAWPKVISRQRL